MLTTVDRVFDAQSVKPADRLAFWRDTISDVFVALDCTSPDPARIEGLLRCREVDDIRLAAVRSNSQHVTRRSQSRRSQHDFFLASFQLEGQCIIRQHGRSAALNPGRFAIYDSSQPYELEMDGPFESITVRLPRDLVGAQMACPERMTAIALGDGAPLSRAAFHYIVSMWQQLDRVASNLHGRISRTATDLICDALAEAQGTAPMAETSHVLAMRQRLLVYIAANARDSDLNPGSIAAANGISLRYLNKLFAGADQSVSVLVWSQRLELARRDLGDCAQRGKSITQIAFDAGFNDLSHFSRIFRTRYGVSPRDYRKGLLAG